MDGQKLKEQPKQAATTKPKKPGLLKRVPMIVWFAILIIVVMLIIIRAVGMGNDGASGSVGESKLNNIQAYLSKSGSDVDKKAQTTFTKGDSIQVGFTYETEESQDEHVRFVVKEKEGGQEAFATNLFKLNPMETELFVSVNNTNLEPNMYVVEIQDKDSAVIASIDYEIVDSQ